MCVTNLWTRIHTHTLRSTCDWCTARNRSFFWEADYLTAIHELDVCLTVHYSYIDIRNQQDAAKYVLLILLSLLYMFRATVSPIFRSTFWNKIPTVLSSAGRQQTAQSVHCSKKLYIQSKYSWRWAKPSPETCRASLRESIKHILKI